MSSAPTSACAIAVGAISALGVGREAYRVSREGEPARCALATDAALVAAGLHRPVAGRAPDDLGIAPRQDRAATLLAGAMHQVVRALDEVRPGWRGERVGVAIGTSSGGMLMAERFFAARAQAIEDAAAAAALGELARGATYFAPLGDALASFELEGAVRCTQVLAACAASTIAIGLGLRWLRRGACDLVLAGGYDGVSVFVAAGFEALRATTASRPRPFSLGRDGMSLGEGAGILALVRDDQVRGAKVLVRVAGFGASTDAVHITAPDRTGGGLARAGAAAIADAGVPASCLGLVSAHATATPFNDAMEARAIASLFEGIPAPVVHPFKAQIGHTLGAAGVLESLAAADALAASVAPAAASSGELDPDARVVLLRCAEPRSLEGALKLSAAFGGANASLVLLRPAPDPAAPSSPVLERSRPLRPVGVRAFARVESADLGELAEGTGVPRDRLARLDTLCRLGAAAVLALAREVGRDTLRGAGIVVGHALATLETNHTFDARKRARGATAVEPRLFPATSPNAVAGECSILFGLTGPSFAVSAGLDGGVEALVAAAELVAAGDADRLIVLAVDDAGPVSRDLLERAGWSDRPFEHGAVAVLLTSEVGGLPEVDLDHTPEHTAAGAPIGHLSLLRWLKGLQSGAQSQGDGSSAAFSARKRTPVR
jgi:3-oxoacyl-[acyl-carrier-protein] synthase-1/3-oxoacyl-[acyl-carrier-protein] synthase II